jgi:hypothetical protein
LSGITAGNAAGNATSPSVEPGREREDLRKVNQRRRTKWERTVLIAEELKAGGRHLLWRVDAYV